MLWILYQEGEVGAAAAWLRGAVRQSGKEGSIHYEQSPPNEGRRYPGPKKLSIVTHSNYTRHLKLTLDINSMTYILSSLHRSCAKGSIMPLQGSAISDLFPVQT